MECVFLIVKLIAQYVNNKTLTGFLSRIFMELNIRFPFIRCCTLTNDGLSIKLLFILVWISYIKILKKDDKKRYQERKTFQFLFFKVFDLLQQM